MIAHILRMIWNRKRANLLLLVEMLLSALVLFLVLSQLLFALQKYLTPLGFNRENVLALNVRPSADDATLNTRTMQEIQRELETWPEIQAICAMTPIPYVNSTWRTSYEQAPAGFRSNIHLVHTGIQDALGAELSEGSWPSEADLGGARTPLVVTRQFVTEYWPDEADDLLTGRTSAIGRDIGDDEKRYRIVGVLPWLRPKGELMQPVPLMLRLETSDGSSENFIDGMLIRVGPGQMTGATEERITQLIQRLAPGWSISLNSLDHLRRSTLREKALPLLIAGLVVAFLLLMVGLGLIGVLWQSVTRRRAELGLRRALGATREQIGLQLLGEIAILSLLAMAGAWLIILQLPFLGFTKDIGWGIFMAALGLSTAMVLLLALLAGAYPGWLSTRIAPSEALHHE